jgi:predicted regulator of Ras-like GTPase activity (Roadblock/LC7/MglB family)
MTSTNLIHHAITSLLRAPSVREAFVCDAEGNSPVQGAPSVNDRQDLIRATVAPILPATKRVARELDDSHEAQSISIPEDDLHILVFWLTDEYSLVVTYSVPQDPSKPPYSAIKACHLLRTILQTTGQPDAQLLSSLDISMESEIFIERQILSHKKETGGRSNLFDASYVQAQQKEVVRIAREMLSGDIGVIEGARLLVGLRPTVTRDSLDPDFLPFAAISSETGNFPIGKQRDLWAPSALEQKDKEIRQAEELHRPSAHAACRVLIKRFDLPT